MTAKAQFKHGTPTMVDYTPGVAVVAGDIVAVGNKLMIAHKDIAANAKGSLADFGGVYKVAKTAGGGTAIAVGKDVFWDAGNSVATETSKGNKFLGHTVLASVDADTVVWVMHGLPASASVGGVAGGYRLARGQATTVAASDTIVTGLATVVAVVASLDSDPIDDPEWVSASIGDQAGTPAAGSFLLKTWKNTAGNDPTPAAASTFGKKVNWIAIGT